MKKICCLLSILYALSFAITTSAIAASPSEEQLEAIAIQFPITAESLLAAEAARHTKLLAEIDSQLDTLTRTLSNPDDPRILAATRQRDRVIEQLEAIAQRMQRVRDGVGSPAVTTELLEARLQHLKTAIEERIAAIQSEQSRERRHTLDAEILMLAAQQQRMMLELERARLRVQGLPLPPAVFERLPGGLPPALAPEVVEQMNRDREEAYKLIAHRYFMQAEALFNGGKKEEAMLELEKFARVFKKLSPPVQPDLITRILNDSRLKSIEAIEMLEKLLDSMSPPVIGTPASLVVPQREFEVIHAQPAAARINEGNL